MEVMGQVPFLQNKVSAPTMLLGGAGMLLTAAGSQVLFLPGWRVLPRLLLCL